MCLKVRVFATLVFFFNFCASKKVSVTSLGLVDAKFQMVQYVSTFLGSNTTHPNSLDICASIR